MATIPRERLPDSTLGLLRDGYEFIRRRARHHRADLFETRLNLERTICIIGPDAVRLIYDEDRFQRAGAAPGRMTKTLVGEGGLQTIDDPEHGHRKAMVMSLMAPDHLDRLRDITRRQWDAAVRRWQSAGAVRLYDATEVMLFRVACEWNGIRLPERIRPALDNIGDMIESPGAVGPKHWLGRISRRRGERWARSLIRDARTGAIDPPPGTGLHAIASYRDLDGRPLYERVAAVELLNLVRPIVAVDRYIVFLALALHSFPGARDRLAAGEIEPEWFVHEVRRYYPFFPLIAARTRHDFEWHGYHFPAGVRVVVDLYGTNRDPRAWHDPDAFRPERFRDWPGDPFTMVPQGGGDHLAGHRCAGEWVTIEIMKLALEGLLALHYEVPPQDLRMPLSRIPALPNSRVILRDIHPISPRAEGFVAAS